MTDAEDTPSQSVELTVLLEALEQGELELQGLMPWSSNYTFLGKIAYQTEQHELQIPIIYKPQRGERPLWDFPEGTLYKREIAAYVISSALDWNLVPPTVMRSGPHGLGSVQLFINADYEEHYFTLQEGDEDYAEQFRKMALFDIVINNADRKGGHVLIDETGHIWAIDHGIAFHNEYKLRTVIWEWVGQPLTEAEHTALKELLKDLETGTPLYSRLEALLYPREIKAMHKRVQSLVERNAFPPPHSSRAMPWPPV